MKLNLLSSQNLEPELEDANNKSKKKKQPLPTKQEKKEIKKQQREKAKKRKEQEKKRREQNKKEKSKNTAKGGNQKQEKKDSSAKKKGLNAKPKKNEERNSQASDPGTEVLEINLIKNEISVFFDWYKHIALLIVAIFITLLFVGELFWLLYWWKNQGQNQIVYSQDALLKLTREIREVKKDADEANVFKEKLSKAVYLLDNHIYWTNFFDMLEENRVQGVVFTGFEGNIKGDYQIPAKTYNYLNVGKQVDALLKSEYIEDVRVYKANALTDRELEQIEFNMQVEVKPKLFKE